MVEQWNSNQKARAKKNGKARCSWMPLSTHGRPSTTRETPGPHERGQASETAATLLRQLQRL